MEEVFLEYFQGFGVLNRVGGKIIPTARNSDLRLLEGMQTHKSERK